MPRLPQNKNGKKREEKEKYYKEHLLKMQRNAEISATCLKGKESSQLFFSFFLKNPSVWNLAGQKNS